MRTVGFAVLVAFLLVLGSDFDAKASSPIAARYEWSGGIGELTIIGNPGTPFAAATATGDLVASGHIGGSGASFTVPNTGFGTDGAILHVGVGGDVLSLSDPDWAWQN